MLLIDRNKLINTDLSTLHNAEKSPRIQASTAKKRTWEDGAEENADARPEVRAWPGRVQVLTGHLAGRRVRVDDVQSQKAAHRCQPTRVCRIQLTPWLQLRFDFDSTAVRLRSLNSLWRNTPVLIDRLSVNDGYHELELVMVIRIADFAKFKLLLW